MSAKWYLSLAPVAEGYSAVIDISLPGGQTAQCYIELPIVDLRYLNGSPAVYTAAQAAGVVTAVNTEAQTFGSTVLSTPSTTSFDFPEVILNVADWASYTASWTPDLPYGLTATVFMYLPVNSALTTAQVNTLTAAFTTAISALPYTPSGGVTLTQAVIAPASILPDADSSYRSACTSDYTSTTEGDLAGTSVAVTVTEPDSVVSVTGIFDMQSGTPSGSCLGKFNWNGVNQTGVAVVAGPAGTRATAGQTWTVTNVTPGTYTSKLRGSVNAGGAIRGTQTTLSLTVDGK